MCMNCEKTFTIDEKGNMSLIDDTGKYISSEYNENPEIFKEKVYFNRGKDYIDEIKVFGRPSIFNKDKMPFDILYKQAGKFYIEKVCLEKKVLKNEVRWQYICKDLNKNIYVLKNRGQLVKLINKEGQKIKAKFQDLTGKTFGKLKVDSLFEEGKPGGKGRIWKCFCSCGNPDPVYVTTAQLNAGVKSCGCINGVKGTKKMKKYPGAIINHWILLKSRRKGNNILWTCKCECCGEIREFSSKSFNSYFCKKRKEEAHILLEKMREEKNIIPTPRFVEDLTGRTYNYITILGYAGKVLNNYFWVCKCNKCGSTFIGNRNFIKDDNMSCGCIASKGEEKILMFLNKHNIKFIPQKSFSDCRYRKRSMLRFDFLIYYPNSDNYFLLEYQGIIHYEMMKFKNQERMRKEEENFIERKVKDRIKKEYCKDNAIELVEIPYWDFKRIDEILAEKLGIEIKNT